MLSFIKKRAGLIVLLAMGIMVVSLLYEKPVYLNLKADDIASIHYKQRALMETVKEEDITKKNEVEEILGCFKKYNLMKHKAQPIDAIYSYCLTFYLNDGNTIDLYYSLDFYNQTGYIEGYDNYHGYFYLPKSFIELMKNK